jgi:hypothetical protein
MNPEATFNTLKQTYWFTEHNGARIGASSWQTRRNVKAWVTDATGNYLAIPHDCEQCGAPKASYGHELGMHCATCWVQRHLHKE